MNSNLMNDKLAKVAADWFVQNQSENLSEEECAAFLRWLTASSENERAYAEIEQIWAISGQLDDISALAGKKGLDKKVTGKNAKRISSNWLYAITGIAASMLLVVGLVLINATDVYQTDIGEQRLVTLQDGSSIEMNTDTEIAVEMGDAVRFIRLLKGEAIFTVAHDEQWPFVVEAGGHQVTALGTEFNVYQKHDRYELVVLEGSVRVAPVLNNSAAERKDEHSLYNPVLAQGEMVTFSGARISKPEPADNRRIEAWRSGKLVFDAEPLVNVLLEVNRYSSEQVALGRPDLGDFLISGTFHTNDTGAIVLALSETLPLTFSETPGGYLLMPK